MEKELKEQFEKMEKHIDEKLDEVLLITKSGFDELSGRMDNMEKDVGVLKQDVGVLKQDVGVLKQDVSEIRIRLSAIESEIGDIKKSIERLEKKTQEDDDAVVLEIENLKKRVSFLEMQLKVRQMQTA